MQAPKKSLGQHFLINSSVCRRIVDLLEPGDSDNILEIGPGLGALTHYLLNAAHARLLLIEKDAYWAAEQAKNAKTLNMDALDFDWQGLQGPWKLVGNLPYNVASPLIWDIVSTCQAYERAVFMVQKEVAQRIVASPGSRQYGALSVWCQSFARVRLAFCVAPGSFRPPPKVDSGVVVFEPLPAWPAHPSGLRSLLNLCFQQRRKQLGTILRKRPDLAAGLARLGIEASLRPENLSPGQFMALADTRSIADSD